MIVNLEKINSELNALGKSQRRIAKELEVPVPTLNKALNGQRKMSVILLFKISAYLKKDINYFMEK